MSSSDLAPTICTTYLSLASYLLFVMRELSSRLAGRSNRRVLTIIISRFWTADVLAFWGAASAVSALQIGDPAPDCAASAVAALVLVTVSAVSQVIVHRLRRHPLQWVKGVLSCLQHLGPKGCQVPKKTL